MYEDLSNGDLLNQCLGGYTQNNNESFNSVVWSIAPKTSSSGKLLVDIAVDIAVCTINENCYNFCVEANASHIAATERSMTEATKDARKVSKSSRKEKEEENLNLEGQLYGAGIAE